MKKIYESPECEVVTSYHVCQLICTSIGVGTEEIENTDDIRIGGYNNDFDEEW